MKKVRFNCTVLTPMFLNGAEKTTPEWRPPSIKAAMRFWWRAAQAPQNPISLCEKESALFGGVGLKPSRTKFSVSYTHANICDIQPFSPLPHHRRDNLGKCICGDTGCRKNYQMNAIAPGSTATIELSSFDDKALAMASKVLELTLLLGGLGKRNRRGFGSLQATAIFSEGAEQHPMNYDTLIKNIETLLLNINPDLKNILSKPDISALQLHIRRSSPLPGYPVITDIHIGTPVDSWENLLIKTGQSSHEHSSRFTGCANPRFASPEVVSVLASKSGQFIPIITSLNCDYKHWNGKDTRADFRTAIL